MSSSNSSVEKHYSNSNIYEKILAQLNENGVNLERMTRNDLGGVDEFHVRGTEVSLELAELIGFDDKTEVLDVGCGIGGPARMLAETYGCKVTGIDLTDDYIRTANLLSEHLGLQDLTHFIQANALQLPFEDDSYNVVWTQHVQMNVENKDQMYADIYRVLKPGGRFLYYDIFSNNHQAIHFPVPWAGDDSLSFLATTSELQDLLKVIGFTQQSIMDQTQAGIIFFANTFHRIEKEGPPKLGLDIIMGESAELKLKNVLKNLTEGKIVLQSGVYCK